MSKVEEESLVLPGGPLRCCNCREETTIWSLACRFEWFGGNVLEVDDDAWADGGGVFGVTNEFEFADVPNKGVWSKSSWGL